MPAFSLEVIVMSINDFESSVYNFHANEEGVCNFIELLQSARHGNAPLAVFKLSAFKKKKKVSTNYVFHAYTFKAVLVNPVNEPVYTDSMIDGYIRERVALIKPHTFLEAET
jgi:hypothetical protein